jgi:hypothetical protein
VERNIYRRVSGVYEVGVKDIDGRQRWRTADGGITAASAVRDELLVRRGRAERVAANPRLRFADAVSSWLDRPVVHLRPATQDCYRNAAEQHLLPRDASRRLDAVTPDDLAKLVRELRAKGLAESTIAIVIGVTNRVYRYAARRMGWAGTNPISLMLPSERPKPSQDVRRRLFQAGELEQTIAAAPDPTGRCSRSQCPRVRGSRSRLPSGGRTWGSATGRTRRWNSHTKSTDTATFVRRRPTTLCGPCRSRASSL